MDEYRKLQENLKRASGNGRTISIYQGIVRSVTGNLCEVTVGGITIPGVRLKASEMDDDGKMLIIPKIYKISLIFSCRQLQCVLSAFFQFNSSITVPTISFA